MNITKEQRAELREMIAAAAFDPDQEGLRGMIALLIADADEMEAASEKLAKVIDCGAPPTATCALPPRSRCYAHTVGALLAERRQLRLELAGQQAEARALRMAPTFAAGRVMMPARPFKAPEFPDWDAEIERGRIRDALATEMPRMWANIAVALPPDGPAPIGFTIEETIALRERCIAAGGRLVLIVDGEEIGELVVKVPG